MANNKDTGNVSEGNESFSFAAFANAPFYRKINTDLVELSQVHPGQHVVDLACGTGGVTKIILEKLRGARESLVIGARGLCVGPPSCARRQLCSA